MSNVYQEIQLNTPLGKVAGKLWGPSGGKKVLALHGWLDNAATFDGLAPHLGGCRIAALDLIGHGHSDHLAPGLPYHLVDSIPNAVSMLDALGWEKCSVMGHSLGAGILSLLAAAIPERIEKVVFIEALGPLSSPADEMPDRVKSYLVERDKLKTKTMPLYPTIEDAVKARLKAGDIAPDSVRTLCQRGLKEVEGGFTWRTDPRLRFPSLQRLTEEEVLAFLKRIESPTLLIEATHGLIAKFPQLQARRKAVAKLDTLIVDGNHHVHMDDAEIVSRPIRNFLS